MKMPPSDSSERITAAMAHGSIIVPTFGILVPILIWVTQKDKSRYVAYHALQGLSLQVTMLLYTFLGGMCYMFSFLGFFLTDFTNTPSNQPPAFFFVPFGVMGLMMLGMFLFSLYGIIAAVMVALGKDFQYPLLGHLAERIVFKEQTPSEVSPEETSPQV